MLSKLWALVGRLLGRNRFDLDDEDVATLPAPAQSESYRVTTSPMSRPPAEQTSSSVPPPGAESTHPIPSQVIDATDDTLGAALRAHLDACFDWLRDPGRLAAGGADFAAVLDALARPPRALVPQLPQAAREALALTQDAESDTEALVAQIRKDPALAQSLLRTANSSYYATTQPISSISDAVTRIGRTGVSNVVLHHVVGGLLCTPGRPFQGMPEALWDHMQHAAPLARYIAPAFNAHPEHAFTLALLHDVGKLVIFDHVAELRRSMRRELKLTPEGVRMILGALHEPLGGMACLSWQLSPHIARAVANHHRRAAPTHSEPLGEVLFVADRADILRRNDQDLDLDALWALGQLRASGARVVQRLQEALEQAA
ncbi:MAG: HDOD domain-containing protein [Bradymonadia bacterium]